MAEFTIKKEAFICYSMTTWEGIIEINGETIEYRYSEDDNGQEVYILTEQGWEQGHEICDVIYACCQEWGNPESFGPIGVTLKIDDEIVEDYK